jgi:hypothetical protein
VCGLAVLKVKIFGDDRHALSFRLDDLENAVCYSGTSLEVTVVLSYLIKECATQHFVEGLSICKCIRQSTMANVTSVGVKVCI